jgi:polysaccharide biosynthesis protein PslG
MSPTQFLSGIYAAGAGTAMDAISVHPYPFSATTLWHTYRTLNEVRAVRDANRDSGRPLWVTELGATTTGEGALTEAQQADIYVGAYRLLRTMPDVGGIYFHTMVEPSYPPWDPETGYAIVRRDFSPKPAFCELAAKWGRPYACS